MSFLMGLFGKQKTPQEMMREYKRSMDRTIRDLDRERNNLGQQEKKLIVEIKKMAKQEQMDAVRVMAKDLIRTRNYITKFYKMRAQMQAVSLKLQTMQSTQSMTEAMKGMTKAMVAMNRQMKIPEMQRIMQEFEKQNDVMDLKSEMMDDAIDGVMDDDTLDEQSEEVVSKVLTEIGLDMQRSVGMINSTPIQAEKQAAAEDDDLEARLAKLRGGASSQ